MASPGTRRAAWANRINAIVCRRTKVGRRDADDETLPGRMRQLLSRCNPLPHLSRGGAWPDELPQVWPPSVSSSSSSWSSGRSAVPEPGEWSLRGAYASLIGPAVTVETALTCGSRTASVDALLALSSDSSPLSDLPYEATVAWVQETAQEPTGGSTLTNPMGPLLGRSYAVRCPMESRQPGPGPTIPLYVRYCAVKHVTRDGQAEPDAPFPDMYPARNEVGRLMGWWSPCPSWMSFHEYVAILRREMYPDWAQPTQPFTVDRNVRGGLRLSVYGPSRSAYYV